MIKIVHSNEYWDVGTNRNKNKWGHHLNVDLYFTVFGPSIKGNGAYHCLCRVSFAFKSYQTDKNFANISEIGAILPKSVKGNLSG